MILAALEAVNNALTKAPQFEYADLNEANFDLDKLVSSVVGAEKPVNLVLPFTVFDTFGKTGLLKSYIDLQGFILMSIKGMPTIDYKSKDVENLAIAPMRMLGRGFIYALNQHSIIDPEVAGITAIKYAPAYSQFDANLFGIEYGCRVPFVEGISGCNH